MRVVTRSQDEMLVLGFEAGDTLDCRSASDVRGQALRAVDGRRDVVIDLSALAFVDSAGMGVLVTLYKRLTARGRRVVLAAAQPYVLRVMRVIRLDGIFEVFTDVPEACRALQEPLTVAACGTRTRR